MVREGEIETVTTKHHRWCEGSPWRAEWGHSGRQSALPGALKDVIQRRHLRRVFKYEAYLFVFKADGGQAGWAVGRGDSTNGTQLSKGSHRKSPE